MVYTTLITKHYIAPFKIPDDTFPKLMEPGIDVITSLDGHRLIIKPKYLLHTNSRENPYKIISRLSKFFGETVYQTLSVSIKKGCLDLGISTDFIYNCNKNKEDYISPKRFSYVLLY